MKSIQVKWLLISIIGILSIISVILCYRLKKLNDSIHNLYLSNSSNDIKEINSLIFESHFKDDLVLSSFNTSTTIIITFFTVIIALGGYLSFKKIDEDINKTKSQLKTVENIKIEIIKDRVDILSREIVSNVISICNFIKNSYDDLPDFYATSICLFVSNNEKYITVFLENKELLTKVNDINIFKTTISNSNVALKKLNKDIVRAKESTDPHYEMFSNESKVKIIEFINDLFDKITKIEKNKTIHNNTNKELNYMKNNLNTIKNNLNIDNFEK